MKLIGLTIAAALAGSIALGAPAAAQMRHVEVHRTTVVRDVHHTTVAHNGRHKVCRTTWRHHHKVRNCWWTR